MLLFIFSPNRDWLRARRSVIGENQRCCKIDHSLGGYSFYAAALSDYHLSVGRRNEGSLNEASDSFSPGKQAKVLHIDGVPASSKSNKFHEQLMLSAASMRFSAAGTCGICRSLSQLD